MQRKRKEGNENQKVIDDRVVDVPIEELVFSDNNPREIRTREFKELMDSLSEDPGFLRRRPVLVNMDSATGEKRIYAGEQRYKAWRALGHLTIPCMVDVDLTREQIEDRMIRDNLHAGRWDLDKLANEFDVDRLKKLGMKEDLAKVGISEDDLDNIEVMDDAIGDVEEDYDDDDDEELETLKEYVRFPVVNEWGIPVLDNDMILDVPNDIDVWCGLDNSNPEAEAYLHIFHNRSTVGLDPARTIIGFYTHDDKFESVWDDNANWTMRFRKMGLLGLLTPDFSTWDVDPPATWINQNYRAYWMGRYWQKAGLKVVPSIQYVNGHGISGPLLKGVPDKPKCISVESHTTKTDPSMIELEIEKFRQIIDGCHPEKMIIYGNDFEYIRSLKQTVLSGTTVLFVETLNTRLGKVYKDRKIAKRKNGTA